MKLKIKLKSWLRRNITRRSRLFFNEVPLKFSIFNLEIKVKWQRTFYLNIANVLFIDIMPKNLNFDKHLADEAKYIFLKDKLGLW